MSKNLLIGAITNYIWDDVAPFFESFRQAGFENCDCVMFTGNMSERTLNRIRACGVKVLPIPEECLNGGYLSGVIVFYRFKLYYDFISKRRSDYDMVLTADVKDVIFQRDLFKLYDTSKPFLGVAMEPGTIGRDQSYNSTWIRNGYGEEIYRTVKDKTAICMGTIWGTCSEFLRFIGELVHELEAGKSAGKYINDQGSGNVILHTSGKFDDVMFPSTNQDGYVMTIGTSDDKDIHIDSAGNIFNGKGEIAAVVHQYDRKYKVTKVIGKKYAESMSIARRLNLTYPCRFIRRVFGFIVSVRRVGLINAVKKAINKRLHH